MGCFQKLRKLIFSKKRGKREEDNLNLLARIEEFQRKLEQKDATICRLEKTLEEKNIEKELVKATLLGKVTDLEIQMKKECLAAVKVELKLLLKIWELCEVFQQSHLDKKNCEMKLRNREAESENMQALLNGRIKELEKGIEGHRVMREQEKKEEKCAENGQLVEETMQELVEDVMKKDESVQETVQEQVENVMKKEELFLLADEEESEQNPHHFSLWKKMMIVTGGLLVGLVVFALARIDI
jgi:hypothetical protein